jgi:FkbM family methyltransferase
MNVALFFRRLKKLSHAIQSKRSISALIINRVLADSEHRQVLTPSLATIVDVGANRGQFSLAARIWSPKASVIAFEPLEKASLTFRDVFRGDTRVTLHQAAIGPQTCETIIHVSAADDSSSLLPISYQQERLFPGTKEIGIENIKIGPLWNFIVPDEIISPAMLKIDVQGYELQALKGCEKLIHRFSYVYAECSFIELYTGQALANKVISWLSERHFGLSGIHNIIYDHNGKSVQADFLFENLDA